MKAKLEPKPRGKRAKKPLGLDPLTSSLAYDAESERIFHPSMIEPFYTTPSGGEFVPERAEQRMTIAGLADEYKQRSERELNIFGGSPAYLPSEWRYWAFYRDEMI